jgi:hypothetical protein
VVSASFALLIGIAMFLRPWSYPPGYRGSARIDEAVPYNIKTWSGAKSKPANNDIRNVVFYQTINRHYRSSRSKTMDVDLFIGVGEHLDRYRSPFSPKIAFPGRGWVIEDEGVRGLDEGSRQVGWRVLSSGTRRLVAYQWYEEDYGLLAESLRSFLALDRSPFFRYLPSMAVRITTEIPDTSAISVELAHLRLENFYQGLEPMLRSFQGEILDDRDESRQSRASVPAYELPQITLAGTRRF